ncbi:MAG TPA: hypothetical protein VFM46_02365, partial [Pseudomonadales bacterium]|nr:hypothetical protein [Pseudomonadales bacterium]
MKYPLLTAVLLANTAAAATAPNSLFKLFNSLPDLPASAQEAATWVDQNGALTEPHLLALKGELNAHQQALKEIAASYVPQEQAQAQAQLADLNKGMANIGIDMQRMQTDPAYAQSMQERMRHLSPEEMLAMSQQMAQPMNQDKRLTNEAQAQVEDSSAVKTAA